MAHREIKTDAETNTADHELAVGRKAAVNDTSASCVSPALICSCFFLCILTTNVVLSSVRFSVDNSESSEKAGFLFHLILMTLLLLYYHNKHTHEIPNIGHMYRVSGIDRPQKTVTISSRLV